MQFTNPPRSLLSPCPCRLPFVVSFRFYWQGRALPCACVCLCLGSRLFCLASPSPLTQTSGRHCCQLSLCFNIDFDPVFTWIQLFICKDCCQSDLVVLICRHGALRQLTSYQLTVRAAIIVELLHSLTLCSTFLPVRSTTERRELPPPTQSTTIVWQQFFHILNDPCSYFKSTALNMAIVFIVLWIFCYEFDLAFSKRSYG